TVKNGEAPRRGRTMIRASHDQGKTWGKIYTIDSDAYPGGRGGFSTAHGNLVVAYSAAQVPANLNAQCPCTVFGTSRDDGRTFEYRIVPRAPGEPPPPPTPAPGAGRGGPGGPGAAP